MKPPCLLVVALSAVLWGTIIALALLVKGSWLDIGIVATIGVWLAMAALVFFGEE